MPLTALSTDAISVYNAIRVEGCSVAKSVNMMAVGNAWEISKILFATIRAARADAAEFTAELQHVLVLELDSKHQA